MHLTPLKITEAFVVVHKFSLLKELNRKGIHLFCHAKQRAKQLVASEETNSVFGLSVLKTEDGVCCSI